MRWPLLQASGCNGALNGTYGLMNGVALGFQRNLPLLHAAPLLAVSKFGNTIGTACWTLCIRPPRTIEGPVVVIGR